METQIRTEKLVHHESKICLQVQGGISTGNQQGNSDFLREIIFYFRDMAIKGTTLIG